ncbi:hypothetical protein SF83666_a44490 (plasmid) [Sinorhizobium fredii CCBAU 83666]|nr:hypothetical protein SF83666_a44490 [Sinorhizobium fredii CCBAU 83666]
MRSCKYRKDQHYAQRAGRSKTGCRNEFDSRMEQDLNLGR